MYNPADGYTNAMELEGGVCFFLCRNYQQFADLCLQYNADPLDERYQLVTTSTPVGSLTFGMFPLTTRYVVLGGAPEWAIKYWHDNSVNYVNASDAFLYMNHEVVPPVYGKRRDMLSDGTLL